MANTLADILNAEQAQRRAQMTHEPFTPYHPAVEARQGIGKWAQGVSQRSSLGGMLAALASEAQRYQQMPVEELAGQFGGGMVGKIGKTEFELAHEVAQRNAALPIEQGGLGLPPNNTAMDRARAMGFMTAPSKQTYHGARGELIGDIDPSMSDLGFHTGSLEQAENRLRAFGTGSVNFGEGANILPLLVSKYSNLLPVKDIGTFHAEALAPQLEQKKILAKGKGKQIAQEIEKDFLLRKQYDQQMRDVLEQQGYGGIKYANEQEGSGKSFSFIDPTLIRSRFAAFDPMKSTSANILAGGLGGAVGLNTLADLANQQEY